MAKKLYTYNCRLNLGQVLRAYDRMSGELIREFSGAWYWFGSVENDGPVDWRIE